MEYLKCPKCGNNSLKEIVGIEYLGSYDGVLVWDCKKCNTKWHRFNGKIIKKVIQSDTDLYGPVKFTYEDGSTGIGRDFNN